ncbi:short-subunit dehydrogenase [Rhodococcus sp. SMB37]|uniref:SDR family NAD(P)-dependent oxidoreductase n=1 Tax=Rhodococcus sp. SMB37 TaxID=2512213 RepID=UPI0010534A07|nr:SDR family NAD(P)-dependent oxidoreductase [Rhodococcus sp. SMB37]TCN52162.1 short-subunit dehydrogenase [Rhodococcus sp. SMB37]
MASTDGEFARRYGSWGLVVGASEGVGEAFAHALAERGVNVVLLSRRKPNLDILAETLRERHGVKTEVLAVDLSESDAVAHIVDGTARLEIGIVLYGAGADSSPAPFLSRSVESALAMVQRNCVTSMALAHHFGAAMVERGRGGIILVTSGSGLRGCSNMVAYSASKAFDLVMGESLWAEFNPEGVDVLSLVLSRTDTPALRRLMLEMGQIESLDTPVPGATSPEDTVARALENLDKGPTCLVGEQLQQSEQYFSTMTRNEAVRVMAEATRSLNTAAK